MRWTSAPASTSSAASRSAFGVVLVYWKRPVSVTSAMYSASAMSGVSSTSSSRKRSRNTSPVEEASGTIRLICPKRVLSWWWSMSTESGTRPSTSGSAIRLSFAQSTASRTRSETSSGQRRRSSASGMNAYSPGSGASPWSTISASLPSCLSARCIARSEPSASPSGFSCVVIRKRSLLRIASATAVSSLAVVWGEFIDQLGHADPALDRRIVLERELRSAFQMQLASDARLQNGVRRLQGSDRLHSLPLRAEHRDEHARMAEIGRRLDAGDGDEADSWVLELPHSLRQDLPDRLVDAAHALGHAGYSSAWTLSSSPASHYGASSPHWRAGSAGVWSA